MPRSSATSGSSYIGKYVEETIHLCPEVLLRLVAPSLESMWRRLYSFMSRSSATSGSSCIGKYVEETIHLCPEVLLRLIAPTLESMWRRLYSFMSRSSATSDSSYIGKYVEETLSSLPRRLVGMPRRTSCRSCTRLNGQLSTTRRSHHQATISSQFQQRPQRFQQAMWQPHPSQWPSDPVGPQPSVWGSQDRSYVQQQFSSLDDQPIISTRELGDQG